MKPDRIALIKAAATKRRKPAAPPAPYLKTSGNQHRALGNWNFRVVRK